MAKMSDFGKAVKIRLIELDKSQVWLSQEVSKKTGLYCDKQYLWKVLAGLVKPPKIVTAINEILELED